VTFKFQQLQVISDKERDIQREMGMCCLSNSLRMTDWMNMSFNVKLFPDSFLPPVSVIGSLFHIRLNLKHLLFGQNGCTDVINQLIVLVLICMQWFCVKICEESLYCFTWEFNTRNAMLCCLWCQMVWMIYDAVIPKLVGYSNSVYVTHNTSHAAQTI